MARTFALLALVLFSQVSFAADDSIANGVNQGDPNLVSGSVLKQAQQSGACAYRSNGSTAEPKFIRASAEEGTNYAPRRTGTQRRVI